MISKKIKICFVSIFAYPLFNENCNITHGGSEVQIYNLSKEFAKKEKYDVCVIVGDFGQNNIEEYDGVKVIKSYSLEKNYINYIKAPFNLYNKLKKIDPDVIIQRSACPETGICAYYSKKNNKKFIYSVAHDIDVNGIYANKGIWGKIYVYGLENSDYIVVQNKRQFDLLTRWKKFNHNKIKIIKSGYNIEKSSISKKDYILWVGRSDEWKCPGLFLELAKKFPNEKFIMIMPKSSNINNWKKYSKKAKEIRNLQFIEKVPFNKIQKYFDCAKVFVNTSEAEGFPNTFVQSCKGGTPILSYNVNPDKIIEKYKIGLFANKNFENLVEGLDFLLNNKKIYKEYSFNSKHYVQKEHDVKKVSKEWEKAIIELL